MTNIPADVLISYFSQSDAIQYMVIGLNDTQDARDWLTLTMPRVFSFFVLLFSVISIGSHWILCVEHASR